MLICSITRSFTKAGHFAIITYFWVLFIKPVSKQHSLQTTAENNPPHRWYLAYCIKAVSILEGKKDRKYIFKVSLHTTSFFRALKWQKAHSIQWLYFSSLCFLLSFVKIATFNNPRLIFKYYRQFYTVAYSVTYTFTKIHMYFYTYCSSVWFNIKHEIKLQSTVNVNITITEELLVFHIKWVKAYIYSTNTHQSCLNYHLKQFQMSWITILKSNVKIMQLTFVITNRPGLNAINHSI